MQGVASEHVVAGAADYDLVIVPGLRAGGGNFVFNDRRAGRVPEDAGGGDHDYLSLDEMENIIEKDGLTVKSCE